MDHRELKKLVQLMNDNELVELEIEQEGMRVSLRKAVPPVGAGDAGPRPGRCGRPPRRRPVCGTRGGAKCRPGTELIRSPMVGTFYRRPSPDADPYVDVGATVDEETVDLHRRGHEGEQRDQGRAPRRDRGDPRRGRRSPWSSTSRSSGSRSRRAGAAMFERILIANRGEIALRVIRACRELEIESVVVYSKADAGAPYLDLADEAICIGPGPSHLSYLSIPSIISAAEIANVDAVHPGLRIPLGERTLRRGLPREQHRVHRARRRHHPQGRRQGGRPEGRASPRAFRSWRAATGPSTTDEEALEVAHRVGYPVLVKAVSGGGGRGMRVAHNDISLQHNLATCPLRGRGRVRRLHGLHREVPRRAAPRRDPDPRGPPGNRRSTWATATAPSSAATRRWSRRARVPGSRPTCGKKMGRAAVKLAKSVGYHGAGTVEFLVQEKKFYFIEVNARVQVEHPVSELVTGIDIVKEQIRVAAGESLGRTGRSAAEGCAIECRINAEDPDRNFAPSPGVDHPLPADRRARRARRLPRRGRVPGPAELRLADREAAGVRRHARRGDPPDAARARGDPDRGHLHDPAAPQPHPPERLLRPGRLQHPLPGRSAARARPPGMLTSRRGMVRERRDTWHAS